MPIQSVCPKCQTQYNLADQFRGKAVKCRACGTAFIVGAAAQQPVGAMAATSGGQAGRSGANQSAELSRYGVDGPIVRKSTDIFSGALTSAQTGTDPLGNHVIDDPGFAGSEKQKGRRRRGEPEIPISQTPVQQARPAIENPVFENPYAASAVAFRKPARARLNDVIERQDQLEDVGLEHNRMLTAFVALIIFNVVFGTVLGLIIAISGYAIEFQVENWGMPVGLYYTVLILNLIVNIVSLVLTFTLLAAVFRLARSLFPNSSMTGVIHVFFQFLPLINLIDLIYLDRHARRQLREGGFTVGLFGVKKSA